MARIRTIKPEFFKSRTIASLPLHTRLTFIGLWTYVDDYGVGKDDERLIFAELWPLEEDMNAAVASTRESLARLRETGLITRYTVDGASYLAVVGWAEHQKVDRPSRHRLPGPDSQGAVALTCDDGADVLPFTRPSRDTREDASSPRETLALGTGNREQGTEEPFRPERSAPTDQQASPPDPEREDVGVVCDRLAELIVANGGKRPTITAKWRDSARLMLDRDKRPFDEVLYLIDWCQRDSFWKSNILSLPKFREKYDALRLKAQSTRPQQNQSRAIWNA